MVLNNFFSILIIISAVSLPCQAILNFYDEYFNGTAADRYNWAKHPCNRKCTEGNKPQKCEYVFVIEQLSTMSKACYDCPFNVTDCFRPHCMPANGEQKTVYVANRLLPGPPIEVCQYDRITVEVRNRMLAEGTTIHWHGIKQLNTPYMDGVPFVTQCPILPGDHFQYTFNASESGTFFWHSHIGSQRPDGLFGPLIIHPAYNKSIHHKLYDEDNQRIIVTDWMTISSNDALVKEYQYESNVHPNSILVNGLGRFKKFKRGNGTVRYTPLATFEVEKKKRYRFRFIDAGAEDCPIEMSIDNHTLQVISLDSRDIEPVVVDAITIWPGERVDFILCANQTADNYWIRFRGYGQCQDNATDGVHQVAILHYSDAKVRDPTAPIGYEFPKTTNRTRVLNPYQAGTETSHKVNISIPLLNSADPNDEALRKKVDQQIYISFDFYPLDNYDFQRKHLYGYNDVPSNRSIGTLQLNHITLKMPTFPLLSQYNMIKPDSLCNSTNIPQPYCTKEQCACTHVIQVKLNSVVELVFVDEGNFGVINHPFHLHGHFFRVVATKNLEGPVTIDRVKKLDKEGKIKRRLDRAPVKDTMKAPGGGYTIVRFYANNPGYWFFHCHFEQHMNVGMALIFKVGEHHQYPPKPKNFPVCGNFIPDPIM